MQRWLAFAVLGLCACSSSSSPPNSANPATGGTTAMSEPASSMPDQDAGARKPQPTAAGTGGRASTTAGAAGAAGARPQPSAAGTGGAGAAGGGGASAGSNGSSAGAPATISLTVEPDREHLYEDDSKWLCLPGKHDELCTMGLDATVIHPDGTTEVEQHVPAADPSFDCFYVYPTVSNDSGANADWMPGTEETDCVTAQAGRYSRVCRVFAPLYRQITLTALNGGVTVDDSARKLGYQDVVAAFNHYLTQYNQGRGFVLIGHSQGSGVLRTLLMSEIDGRPELRARLISAHLLGAAIAVPEGQDVGGDLKNIPVCRKNDQAGCLLAYSTFRDSSPPPSNSKFGKVAMGRAVCANPAALGGGKATLDPYMKPSQLKGGTRVTTPFVHLPDFLQGECVDRDEFTYLELSVLPSMSSAHPTDVSADIGADWGLHLIDVHIAMGSLVDLAGAQAAAFAAQQH
jgi:Protein of unknown function (DUF3089)